MAERADAEVLARKPVTVELGDREFPIKPQVYMKAAAFRDGFGALWEGLENLGEVIEAVMEAEGPNVPLSRVVRTVTTVLVTNRLDEALRLIFVYDPDLAENQKWIKEHAYDRQMIDAFLKIVGLVYGPFGALLPLVTAASPRPKKEQPHSGSTESEQENGSSF